MSIFLCIVDVDGKQNLLENIPQIGEQFEVISKIGEGKLSGIGAGEVGEDADF